MQRVLLVQLPIPQLNFPRQTGNIPLAGACLAQAASSIGVRVDILPESLTAYLGDTALLERIEEMAADIIGFSVFSWNLHRSLHFAELLKQNGRPRIVFGGPEVTADNLAVQSPYVDFYVYGEGEAVFQRLLSEPSFWEQRFASLSADRIFRFAPSPYPAGMLQPGIENMVLLETQRGCPYGCGYCYYPKDRDRIALKEEGLLLDTARWTAEHGIKELYFLDPSLNTRPRLKTFLERLRETNPDRRMAFISEIRAEAVDAELAVLLARAGFNWFEIGLQSTNPEALRLMNRPTDLDRFLSGVARLKEQGIVPRIDLIAGLPGDDLPGFIQSVDFVAAHELAGDVQVFPLSILPGTDFRRRAGELGIQYLPHPPYVVAGTDTFSESEMGLAFDYAEYRLDITLHPYPDLDIAWLDDDESPERTCPDRFVRLDGREYLHKLILIRERPLTEIEKAAARVTQPYQIVAGPEACDSAWLAKVLGRLTRANPHTPLEVVFLDPNQRPDPDRLLSAIRLRRPHFLDVEQRFMFPEAGNRAVLFTLVSREHSLCFEGPMLRQVFWWRAERLPDRKDLTELEHLDGVLIDSPAPTATVSEWQDRFAPSTNELLSVSFARVDHQRRWLRLTRPADYWLEIVS